MTETFFAQNIWLLVVLVLWVLPWKGYALWLSARNGHKWWFIALLVINTLAILEIIYIFAVGLKQSAQNADCSPDPAKAGFIGRKAQKKQVQEPQE